MSYNTYCICVSVSDSSLRVCSRNEPYYHYYYEIVVFCFSQNSAGQKELCCCCINKDKSYT